MTTVLVGDLSGHTTGLEFDAGKDQGTADAKMARTEICLLWKARMNFMHPGASAGEENFVHSVLLDWSSVVACGTPSQSAPVPHSLGHANSDISQEHKSEPLASGLQLPL